MSSFQKIEPSRKIPLTYLLYDATIAPTRYIQSVIKNPETQAVIATVNLTDNGDGDFSDYSKTPASLFIAKSSFFEVITTVYKTNAYTTPDSLRYAVVKQTYLVAEELGGAILGGREVGSMRGKGVDLDQLVKKIFSYNKLLDHREKSFAYRFLGLINTTEKMEKNIPQLHEEINKSIKEFDNNILELARLVVSGFKNIKIPDNEKEFKELKKDASELKRSFKILQDYVKKADGANFFKRLLEIGDSNNIEFCKNIKSMQDKLDEMIEVINDSNNKAIGLSKELLLDIKFEINSFLQELETKVDELNED